MYLYSIKIKAYDTVNLNYRIYPFRDSRSFSANQIIKRLKIKAMRQSATFRAVNPITGEVVMTYRLPYTDANDLQALYSDARRAWDEYHVEAETDLFTMSHSHTWREQVLREEEELQWAYMNGEFPEDY